jgi:hypothetical protein
VSSVLEKSVKRRSTKPKGQEKEEKKEKKKKEGNEGRGGGPPRCAKQSQEAGAEQLRGKKVLRREGERLELTVLAGWLAVRGCELERELRRLGTASCKLLSCEKRAVVCEVRLRLLASCAGLLRRGACDGARGGGAGYCCESTGWEGAEICERCCWLGWLCGRAAPAALVSVIEIEEPRAIKARGENTTQTIGIPSDENQ